MGTSSKHFGTGTVLWWILVSIIGWVLFPLDRLSAVRAYANVPRLLLAYIFPEQSWGLCSAARNPECCDDKAIRQTARCQP